jgi:glycosyltransferase involved in cell wall biosynthesis
VQNSTQERDCLAHYHRQPVLIPSYYEVPQSSLGRSLAERPHGDYILWVAAMRPGKRAELVFDLARRLPHRRFVMIGGAAGSDGTSIEYYEQLRAQALQLPNVEFLGFLPLTEVEPWFDQARLVLNTSASEGMPNIFLQAWARGVPTVAFIDVAAHLADGPVYPVVADLDQAVAEIECLHTDEARWQRASARCHGYFVANHCTAGVLSRYAALFSDLMTEPEPHG